MKGNLTVYTGPVSSGKTTQLCHDLNQYQSLACFKVLYINSKLDTRGEGAMSTHNQGINLAAGITKIKILECTIEALSQVNINLIEYDIIGLDEASFFPCLDEVIDWIDIHDKIVIVAGLDGSYLRSQFGTVTELIKHADTVRKFNGKCVDCLHEEDRKVVDAPFSAKIAGSCQILEAGGQEKYIPVCRQHWIKRNKVSHETNIFNACLKNLSRMSYPSQQETDSQLKERIMNMLT